MSESIYIQPNGISVPVKSVAFEMPTIDADDETEEFTNVIYCDGYATIRLTWDVTSINAADDLDCVLYGNDDDGHGWYVLGSFTTVDGAAGAERFSFPTARRMRAGITKTTDTAGAVSTLSGELAGK